ncbi:unnamed protein product [Parnassius apollo]|uniref:(apollo) hypothetical protein n=1 Tax=Parnassius apollo TaxID=110799 RepID=A0A8S3WZW7_PARAO|nr:unnamed protein product [Parnassius apollo]
MCLIFVPSIVTEKLNDCNRCKVLSNSFKNWLQKTARGKYEGGDAAWEEAKLKSYSRSEMRLVEIQEGLCSDVKKHQDQCYALAEEVEHLLEQWWVHEDPNSQDVFAWLCVSTLHYCCPKNHYGMTCAPCPKDENNKICGGRGECNGDGTRQGNGTCICNRGFSGQFCESCAENFYSIDKEYCKPCHKACNGCRGEGAAACKFCKPGWELESGACNDINECANISLCKSHQFCINWEGSYACRNCDDTCRTCKGEGLANCTSCESNYMLWGGMCLDKTLKQQIFSNALKKLGLYVFLIVAAILMYKRMKAVSSLTVLLIGIIIYFSEKESQYHIFSMFYEFF